MRAGQKLATQSAMAKSKKAIAGKVGKEMSAELRDKGILFKITKNRITKIAMPKTKAETYQLCKSIN